MRLLLGIKSCQRDMERGDHDAIRNTWGRDVEGDLRFFVGVGSQSILKEDESRVFVPDGYNFLTLKTIEIVREALHGGYDYLFLADTDTFLIPRRLMTCGFENWDFYGFTRTTEEMGRTFVYGGQTRDGVEFTIPRCYPWCSGGYGYFLSRKAMQAVLDAPPPVTPIMVWAEDLWVGQVLGPLHWEKKIRMSCIPNYGNVMSWHFPQYIYHSGYDPKFGWMEEMYAEQKVNNGSKSSRSYDAFSARKAR